MFGPVIQNVLVDLIRDREHIELHAQITNQLQLRPRKNFPRRIVRRIQNDRLRILVERRPQFFFIERPLAGLRSAGGRSFTNRGRAPLNTESGP